MKARQEAKKGELDEQLREYIDEWRKQRAKEEDELKRLKDKQAKRKEIRAEQEKKLAQQKVSQNIYDDLKFTRFDHRASFLRSRSNSNDAQIM